MDNNYGNIDYGTYKDDYVIIAYELISNKWKLKILKYIKPHRPVRYGELLNYVDDITKKVLTDNLKSLEDDGLITRKVISEKPLRVEYSLTEIGTKLNPILKELYNFGYYYKNKDNIKTISED